MPSNYSDIISKHLPDLTNEYIPLYKHFHSNPELSFCEHETAARIAQELQHRLQIPAESIHTGIGGTGLVAVIENGKGPVVLLRADIDALPVEELTELEYASRKTMKDVEGIEKPTMHACGHGECVK
jgi:metal-dependent amidase/aminoacylase/carboxypeptidase family protein